MNLMVPLKNTIHSALRFINSLQRPSKAANQKIIREKGEDPLSFVIREATSDDIPALAALHVKTWADTYRNVENPPTAAVREWQWRKAYEEETDGSWFCYVVENKYQQLIGFAKGQHYEISDIEQ